MSMTQPLRAFQEAFAQALQIGAMGDSTLAALTSQPGFAVYRNTVMKGCIDALAANYPAVARLVGDEWFRAAAAAFVQALPAATSYAGRLWRDFPVFLCDVRTGSRADLSSGRRSARSFLDASTCRFRSDSDRRGGSRRISRHTCSRAPCCARIAPRAGNGSKTNPSFRSGGAIATTRTRMRLRTLVWRGEGALGGQTLCDRRGDRTVSVGGCAIRRCVCCRRRIIGRGCVRRSRPSATSICPR